MDCCQLSINTSVRRLIKGINGAGRLTQSDHRRIYARFYEIILLNVNADNANGPADPFFTILCQLRLAEENELADKLEKLSDKLQLISSQVDIVKDVLRFLAILSSVSPRRNGPVEFENSIKKRFCRLPPPNFGPVKWLSENERCSLPVTLMSENFPVITRSEESKEPDDGFEDDFCPSPSSLCQIPQTSGAFYELMKPKFVSVKSYIIAKDEKACLEMDEQHRKMSPKIPLYLSEVDRYTFHQFLVNNIYVPFDHVMRIKRIRRYEKIICVSFDYFKNTIKNVLFGIENDLISFEKSSLSFVMQANVCLIGTSIEALTEITGPFLKAGANFLHISNHLNEISHCQNSHLIRNFVVSFRKKFELLQRKIENLCNKSTGLLSLSTLLAPICDALDSSNELLCSFREKLRLDEENAILWLIETLFEFCTSFIFCSHYFLFIPIFQSLMFTYVRFIQDWIVQGTCDESGDFFVSCNSDYLECRDRQFWTHAFTFHENKVPSFLQIYAINIFNVGKLTRLMKTCREPDKITLKSNASYCASNFSTSKFKIWQNENVETIEENDEINFNQLEFCSKKSIIDYLKRLHLFDFNDISNKFMNFLFNDCKFNQILNVLRDLYLGANGFFLNYVSDKLFPAFYDLFTHSLNAENFYPSILSRILDDCLEAAKIPAYLLNGVSFLFHFSKMEHVSMADVHFLDSFDLHSTVPWPCNIIITESCLKWLKKIFKFLLALGWAIWSLNDVWNFLNSSSGQRYFLQRHRLMLYQREMKHFLSQLQIYVLHQTVDVCWSDFRRSISTSKDLDQIISAHSKYINDIALKCLLTAKAQPIYKCIRKLLDNALAFRTVLMQEKSEEKAIELYQAFHCRSQGFVEIVEKLAARIYQPHLNELMIRLNFNHFYPSCISV